MNRLANRMELRRLVLCLVALAALVSTTGCATPAYSAQERDKMISRTWRYDGRQLVDDWDEFWLLRPPSRLTIWHVR